MLGCWRCSTEAIAASDARAPEVIAAWHARAPEAAAAELDRPASLPENASERRLLAQRAAPLR